MNARLAMQPDVATTFLDDNGKQAYSSSGLPLIVSRRHQASLATT